jgi:RNA-directed DNA polymerase
MSLATPIAIRTLQRKLYRKAKAEPAFRFYLLYDKIHREDILRHAYALTRFNAGAAGVDGMSFAAIEASGLEEWLAGLCEELISKTYRPDPVRRVMISKPGGGERPLGIPTIRDRVVQTAAKLVLELIFEADFEDNVYGYRPVRGAVDAVKEVRRLIGRGYTDVTAFDRLIEIAGAQGASAGVAVSTTRSSSSHRMTRQNKSKYSFCSQEVTSPSLLASALKRANSASLMWA